MKKYIGTKIIEALPMSKDNVDGYKVIYDNPNNTRYESWSPKEVFEESFMELELHNKKVREKICEIFEESNNEFGQFMPQQYVSIFLDICSQKGVTFFNINK